MAAQMVMQTAASRFLDQTRHHLGEVSVSWSMLKGGRLLVSADRDDRSQVRKGFRLPSQSFWEHE